MAVDPIVHCLERLTDYDQFERLCSDLMAGAEYPDIEPLGGRSDSGRDALHVCRSDANDVTIFAYSVRKDWRTKLTEDCDTIRDCGHAPNRIVFVCTSSFTTGQRDKAVEETRKRYGWDLELYGLERLRLMLTSTQPHLLARHPQIFVPPFFPRVGGVSIAESRDLLVLDHVEPDYALAHWLARRLELCGYGTWCVGVSPIGGESVDQTIRTLIRRRAFRYLPVLTASSVNNADLVARCAIAASEEGMVIPIRGGPYDDSRFDSAFRRLSSVSLDAKWADGIRKLLEVLEGAIAPKTITSGAQLALRSYFPDNVTVPESELLFSNIFAVERLPTVIRRFAAADEIKGESVPELREKWAFRRLSPTRFLAFHAPPEDLVEQYGFRNSAQFYWPGFETIEGVSTPNLVSELLRRSLEARCSERGLLRCIETQERYFPQLENPRVMVGFTWPSGEKGHIGVAGERSYPAVGGSIPYRYSVTPKFRAVQDDDQWEIILRLRIRITNREGMRLKPRSARSRRKHLCKNWWSQEWLKRTLATMCVLGDGDLVEFGADDQRLVISTRPLALNAAVAIDDAAVRDAKKFQEELAEYRLMEEDDEDEDDGD